MMSARGLVGTATLLMLLAATPASATTYTYEGGLYTSTPSSDFGQRITGTVTFDFDTHQFTGSLFATDPRMTNLSFTSGIYTSAGGLGFFNFDAGAITGWNITASVIVCGFVNQGPCRIGTNFYFDGPLGGYDEIAHSCHFCPIGWTFENARALPGTWTASPIPVPGPVVGTGLPALMTLLAWWLRSRRR